MTDITELVERMESAAKAATPGQWTSKGPDEFGDYTIQIDGAGLAVAAVTNGSMWDMGGKFPQHTANATHIAEADPQNVLTFIAEWRAQKAEIERLRSEKDQLARDKFDAGYLLATANLMHSHGEDTLAEDVLKEHGALDAKVIKRLNLTEFDARVLLPLFKEIERKDKLPARKALETD